MGADVDLGNLTHDPALFRLFIVMNSFIQSTDMINMLRNYGSCSPAIDSKMQRLLLHAAKATTLNADLILKGEHYADRFLTFDYCGGSMLVVTYAAPDADNTFLRYEDFCFFVRDNETSRTEHHHCYGGQWMNIISKDFGAGKEEQGRAVKAACRELSYSLFGNENAVSFRSLKEAVVLSSQIPVVPEEEKESQTSLRRSCRSKQKAELIKNVKSVFQRDIESWISEFEPSKSTASLRELVSTLKVFFSLVKPTGCAVERDFMRKLTASMQAYTDVLLNTQDVKFFPLMNEVLKTIDISNSNIGPQRYLKSSNKKVVFRLGSNVVRVLEVGDIFHVQFNDEEPWETDFCGHCGHCINVCEGKPGLPINRLLEMFNEHLQRTFVEQYGEDGTKQPLMLMDTGSVGAVILRLMGWCC